VLLGDEVLRRRAKPVKTVDAAVRRLIDDLVDTMQDAEGLGLAAPQIGVAKRVFVARDGDSVVVLVNPQVRAKSGHDVGVEGCLSMPGLQGNVRRAKELTISALDRSGRTVTYEAEGLLARIFQHEFDHLNGVLFIDHTRDLWWLEEVEPGEEIDDEEEDTDAVEDAEEHRIHLRRVPTTLSEVHEYFEELREDEAAERLEEEALADESAEANGSATADAS
jgi:peptide deformylase